MVSELQIWPLVFIDIYVYKLLMYNTMKVFDFVIIYSYYIHVTNLNILKYCWSKKKNVWLHVSHGGKNV